MRSLALGIALILGLWLVLRWLARGAGPGGAPAAEQDDEDFFDPDEPVEIPIGDSLDLHYFPPRDVGDLVDAYLEAAAERGFGEVRIIHGRGRGVQRNRVRRHLERSPHVLAFDDAPGDRGGWGATVVRLRRPGHGGGADRR